MIDRIEALESKISALVEKTRFAKEIIQTLQNENAHLKGVVEEKHRADEEIARLNARIGQLESELNTRDDKESAAKDRLKAILNRVDSLESDIADLSGTQHSD
jgi:predicted RNase H-like nuclease (RuvC/YqgF family)